MATLIRQRNTSAPSWLLPWMPQLHQPQLPLTRPLVGNPRLQTLQMTIRCESCWLVSDSGDGRDIWSVCAFVALSSDSVLPCLMCILCSLEDVSQTHNCGPHVLHGYCFRHAAC